MRPSLHDLAIEAIDAAFRAEIVKRFVILTEIDTSDDGRSQRPVVIKRFARGLSWLADAHRAATAAAGEAFKEDKPSG